RVSENDAIPTTRSFDDVPPTGRAGHHLALQTGACCRIVESFNEFCVAALESPGGNRRFESGAARGVEVHVRRDVDTARSRFVDLSPGLAHQAAPARLKRSFQVKDLNRQSALLADRNRFFDRLD